MQTLQEWTGQTLVGVNENKLSVRGYSLIPISVKGKQLNAKFIITDDVKVDAILGLDFLKENHCMIDCSKRVITFPPKDFSLPLDDSPRGGDTRTIGLVINSVTTVPAGCELELMVTPLEKIESGAWILEGEVASRHGVMVAHALVCPNNQSVPIRVLNPREQPVVLKKGDLIARMEPVEQRPINVNSVGITPSPELSPEDNETLYGKWYQRLATIYCPLRKSNCFLFCQHMVMFSPCTITM